MTRKTLFGATLLLTATLVVALIPSSAGATCYTTCKEAHLVDSACNTIEGKLQAAPLYFVADCDGSCNPQMGPEYITSGKLGAEGFFILKGKGSFVQNDPNSGLPGTLARDGACAGLPRFRFDGVLEAETAYVVTTESYPIISFETAPEGEFEADGDVGCSVGPRSPASGRGALVLLFALGAALMVWRRR